MDSWRYVEIDSQEVFTADQQSSTPGGSVSCSSRSRSQYTDQTSLEELDLRNWYEQEVLGRRYQDRNESAQERRCGKAWSDLLRECMSCLALLFQVVETRRF